MCPLVRRCSAMGSLNRVGPALGLVSKAEIDYLGWGQLGCLKQCPHMGLALFANVATIWQHLGKTLARETAPHVFGKLLAGGPVSFDMFP